MRQSGDAEYQMMFGLRPWTCHGLVAAAVFLSACGPSDASSQRRASATQKTAQAPQKTEAASATEVNATNADADADPIFDEDQMRLEQAEDSCRNDDPQAFFDSFISSRAVQQKYAASSIRFVGEKDAPNALARRLRREDWPGSPIMMVDYYRKAAVPAREGDASEYVMIEVNQSQSNRLLIEWTRVHFDGESDGGDDLGNAFDLEGRPYDAANRADGDLLFEPTEDCWQLVADRRFAPHIEQ